MQIIQRVHQWVIPQPGYWRNGFLLGAANAVGLMIAAAGFFFTLGASVLLTFILRELTGRIDIAVPFPFPLLIILFALAFLAAWVVFARRLPDRNRIHAFRTALLGATPFAGLSLVGLLNALRLWLFGDFVANQMLEAGIFIDLLISAIILLAGIACVAVVSLGKTK